MSNAPAFRLIGSTRRFTWHHSYKIGHMRCVVGITENGKHLTRARLVDVIAL